MNANPALPTVSLFGLDGLGLIVSWPTGVVYHQQTKGISCGHDYLEGFFVPLGDTPYGALPRLDEIFTGPLGSWRTDPYIDDEAADLIDMELLKAFGPQVMLVDRERLTGSYEAWVHIVLLERSNYYVPAEIARRQAVLTWPNSD